MGGREAIRGFGIQTLICLLDALQVDADWTSVTIEPETDHDKVDIFWDLGDGRRKAVQVKHSQNPIGKADIERWCALLEKENADLYELRLAGPLKSDALKGSFGKVSVPAPASSILLSDLNDQAVTKVDRYLEATGIDPIPVSIRTSLIDICAARLITGASTSTTLKRAEFDGWLLHWITTSYPQALTARLASNCEVLWSTLRLSTPASGSMAFELTAPIAVYNSGRGAAIVEWAIILVKQESTRMIYGSDWMEGPNGRSTFSPYAIGPASAVERSLVFQAYRKLGFEHDQWKLGPADLSLLVKFSVDQSPRKIRDTRVQITGDHMALLNAKGSKDINLSTIRDFIEGF